MSHMSRIVAFITSCTSCGIFWAWCCACSASALAIWIESCLAGTPKNISTEISIGSLHLQEFVPKSIWSEWTHSSQFVAAAEHLEQEVDNQHNHLCLVLSRVTRWWIQASFCFTDISFIRCCLVKIWGYFKVFFHWISPIFLFCSSLLLMMPFFWVYLSAPLLYIFAEFSPLL
ncbi:unnamed protein product [Blepharisma stoltei]|uniref:Uncharacterized protein n=1 Tax=Blepharisma stoltei TaxID=1481888 RepID=A0AAU9J3Q4_9CILI|nr:unnamed protein product [Blepharisma stoltei]